MLLQTARDFFKLNNRDTKLDLEEELLVAMQHFGACS